MNFGGWMNFGGREGTPHPPLRGPLDVCNANSTVACDMLPHWGRRWFSGTPQVSTDGMISVGGYGGDRVRLASIGSKKWRTRKDGYAIGLLFVFGGELIAL